MISQTTTCDECGIEIKKPTYFIEIEGVSIRILIFCDENPYLEKMWIHICGKECLTKKISYLVDEYHKKYKEIIPHETP